MIFNNIEVKSEEHLEELIAELEDSSKEGLRILYQKEQQKDS